MREKRQVLVAVDLKNFEEWEKDLIMGSIDFAIKKSLEVIENINKEEISNVSVC